jgi:hypothetical protein
MCYFQIPVSSGQYVFYERIALDRNLGQPTPGAFQKLITDIFHRHVSKIGGTSSYMSQQESAEKQAEEPAPSSVVPNFFVEISLFFK